MSEKPAAAAGRSVEPSLSPHDTGRHHAVPPRAAAHDRSNGHAQPLPFPRRPTSSKPRSRRHARPLPGAADRPQHQIQPNPAEDDRAPPPEMAYPCKARRPQSTPPPQSTCPRRWPTTRPKSDRIRPRTHSRATLEPEHRSLCAPSAIGDIPPPPIVPPPPTAAPSQGPAATCPAEKHRPPGPGERRRPRHRCASRRRRGRRKW
ncbi:hypothetical protein ZWY2020_018465 [Hordeum vulgare]|nr:hypothetical protein ZWY2020_018465 [Hordeum vulgare]